MDHITPSANARKNFVLFALLFCFSIIVFTIGWGNPSNSLHSSALAWAFAMSGAILGTYIFGAAWDNMTFAKK